VSSASHSLEDSRSPGVEAVASLIHRRLSRIRRERT
jgi:hypothetical protein